ncbi:MAG TPA: DUF4880 domain-containing protein [Methylibium sp.]|nr:DUF4880 domain-containing protein [Methylibium sp.]
MSTDTTTGIGPHGDEPTRAPADAPLDRAIAWAVRLASGSATEAERQACERWRRSDPAHEQAWQQVQAVEQDFQRLPATVPGLAFDTLQGADRARRRASGRRRALQLLGVGTLTSLTAGLGGALSPWLQSTPWLERGHYATAPGERRRERLADGSLLHINTGSEVEQRYSPLRRVIALRVGEVLIDTGRDADSLTGRRPFWLETGEARLEALGTNFRVRRIADAGHGVGETVVQVNEGRVTVHAPAGAPMAIAAPGDTLRIRAGAERVERVADTGLDAAAWLDGVLVARRLRLDAFVAELARYRRQPLRCDPAVADWRVSGVFRLDGPDPVGRALAVLARTLPVRTRSLEGGGQLLVAA